MKKIYALFAALSLLFSAQSQTLFVPDGTNGISPSQNGNVGINNSSPNYKLDVNGELAVGGGSVNANTTKIFLRNPWPGGKIWAISSGTNMVTEASFSIYNWTDNQSMPVLHINSEGFLGLGTVNPTCNLHIEGSIDGELSLLVKNTYGAGARTYLTAMPGKSLIQTDKDFAISTNGGGWSDKFYLTNSGNVGLGISNPQGKLTIFNQSGYNADMTANGQDHILLNANNPGNGGYFGGITWESVGRRRASIVATRENDDEDYVGIAFFTQGTDGPGPMYESMRITRSGNVGIGTTTPHNALDVNGTIRAKEVKVETGWADYVLQNSYKLMPLPDLEKFIKTNGHLPSIPTAAEVEQNGVNLGEMQKRLLEKVEELTLYVIEQEKENTLLKEKLALQDKNYQALIKEIEELKNSKN